MEYKIGDYLVHETNGVCQIYDIDDMELMGKGSLKTYYLMSPVFKPSAKVFTPVNGSSVRLRPVTSPEAFDALIANIDSLQVIDEPNDRIRQEIFKDVLSEFTPEALAIMVKTVLIRKWTRLAMGKKVMASDEKTLAVAGKKLYEELAFSKNISLAEAQKLFEDKVEECSSALIAQ